MRREQVSYQPEINDGFYLSLSKRVNAYFQSNNISRKTNLTGILKAVLFLSLFIIAYFLIILSKGNNFILLSSFAFIGFIQICLVLNLGHEGVHESFSKNKHVNHLLTYTFDLIGTSGYLWKMRHVYSHHPYPMIPGKDVDIEQSGMLTFQPMKSPPSIFKYQKIYAPFLYCFYSLNAIFKRDWVDFFSNKIGSKQVKHKKAQVASFIVSKILYFLYALVLPLIFSGCTPQIVLLGFLLMHLVMSLSAAIALFPAHLYEEVVFPEPNSQGEINTTWAEHQMSVTMDFGTKLPFAGFFFGGINYHAVHHLFPNVAHVHFRELRKIMYETAQEFNIPYHHIPSLRKALISHWKLLKKNGVIRMNEII